MGDVKDDLPESCPFKDEGCPQIQQTRENYSNIIMLILGFLMGLSTTVILIAGTGALK